ELGYSLGKVNSHSTPAYATSATPSGKHPRIAAQHGPHHRRHPLVPRVGQSSQGERKIRARHGAFVRERIEPVLAVVLAHAGGSDAAEGHTGKRLGQRPG